jgi:capsular polysaccharide transport system permease protein
VTTAGRAFTGAGAGAFIHALQTQAAVVRALVLREMQSRFGRDNIGYLWMIGEPMILASAVTAMHTFRDHGIKSPGMGAYPFTVLGYCLFIIFRNVFNRSDGAINGSTPLLYHRMVKPFDIMLAKAFLETVGCISALAVLMTIGILFGLADLPARPLYLIAATFLIAWWSFSLSLIVAAHTYEGHFIGRFVHPFSYFMVPLSGAFVTMTFLPAWTRPYMAWNPMMSMFEMARYGQFASASDAYFYPGYVIAVCAGTTYWGLIAIRKLRSRIHVG